MQRLSVSDASSLCPALGLPAMPHTHTSKAALLSRLHHPNIVSYKESFQDRHGILHIVMGYCEGGDLCTRLKSYGGKLLPETQVVEWFVQIALALQYLHDRKILHRDLKV